MTRFGGPPRARAPQWLVDAHAALDVAVAARLRGGRLTAPTTTPLRELLDRPASWTAALRGRSTPPRRSALNPTRLPTLSCFSPRPGGIAVFHAEVISKHAVVFTLVPSAWIAENLVALWRYGRLSSFHTCWRVRKRWWARGDRFRERHSYTAALRAKAEETYLKQSGTSIEEYEAKLLRIIKAVCRSVPPRAAADLWRDRAQARSAVREPHERPARRTGPVPSHPDRGRTR